MPAYNAEQTLRQTYAEIPFDIVDHVVLVDDASSDHTSDVARELGIRYVIKHKKNKGYGGNQKTCYDKALEIGSDIVVMLHPDYQYTPLLLTSICYMIASGLYPVVIASRILGKGALAGGMPLYKYVANRFLTFIQNLLMGQKLSEYHTGFPMREIRTISFSTTRCWRKFSTGDSVSARSVVRPDTLRKLRPLTWGGVSHTAGAYWAYRSLTVSKRCGLLILNYSDLERDEQTKKAQTDRGTPTRK